MRFLHSMLRYLLLMILLVEAGCVKSPAKSTAYSNLRADFEAEFDRLFLSEEPLCYQDNVAFLDGIDVEHLDPAGKNLVRIKLLQFLSTPTKAREYAPDCEHTGVASEIAFLRLQAVQLLAQVGTEDDIEFVNLLLDDLQGEHPLFAEECRQVIEILESR